jgi:hypothetical protein
MADHSGSSMASERERGGVTAMAHRHAGGAALGLVGWLGLLGQIGPLGQMAAGLGQTKRKI